ncbi:MAG: hypothetical protein N2111_09105 [Candidatus Sumerlaeaceae bacterium]|nr:hypothetical protein [Candidatus Sumerlaeaceae bacterium]
MKGARNTALMVAVLVFAALLVSGYRAQLRRVSLTPSPDAQTAAPLRLTNTSATLTLATLAEGTLYSIPVTLQNDTLTTRVFVSVESSCDCAMPDADLPLVVPPGHNAEMILQLDTTQMLGSFVRNIVLHEDDSLRLHTLSVAYEVAKR